MDFKKLNNIGGWAAFLIAFITYSLTVEPTASFWDCGEFIACAYKLQVPHPAGAPFYLLLGRLASLFAAGNVEKVAFMINMLSVLASAFTILFMFWSISMLARKIIGKKIEEFTTSDTIQVLGASMVGSLVYAWSDSFWFSAVEAEVYGMSSFFTAIVIWAVLKWELIEDQAASNKWMVFIAYLVGLSIGVHLLNLVTIPALGIWIYYKKAKKITWTGGIIAFLAGLLVLVIVMVGVITGIPSLSFSFDKLFVNSFGLPYGSGMIFFIVALIAALVWGINKTSKTGKVWVNTALLSFAFILVGYSTYTIALVRSNYNPPINENDPSDVLGFTYYLKREQYGSRPLTYGPIFSSKLTAIDRGAPSYKMGEEKYEIYDYTPQYSWANEMLLPRIWSQDPNHVRLYRSKLGLNEAQTPKMGDNLRFMFSHQLGHMYWRYFLWNFWGRASDVEGSSATAIFEADSDLPDSLKNNKGRTNFYALPILLGILGLLYQYLKRDRDFIVMTLLFLLTGMGLVVYLNSPPVEPRERDYIYVGSFYIFAMWVGLGVMGLYHWAMKFLKNSQMKAGIASALGLLVPIQMVTQTWDGHDRSDRVHQVDFAKNLLNSVAPNAILFTGGDNDTFPLWYAQEVEGVRTDVRVCNLSLLGTDWYIDQMKRKTYESEALPISFTKDQVLKGINDQIPFVENPNEQVKAGINLKQYLSLVRNNERAIQMAVSSGDMINTLPSQNLFLEYDPEKVKAAGFIPEEFEPGLTGVMKWSIGERDLLKNDLMVLDIIAHNDWERPIYFGGTLAPSAYLNLKDHLQLEGYAYRLTPVQIPGARDGIVNTEVMYNKVMNEFEWENLDNTDVYYDSETYLKVPIITARYSFLRLADQLVREGDNERAEKVLDKCLEVMPHESIPYDQLSANFATFYYAIDRPEKAKAITDVIVKRADEELTYFIEKSKTGDYKQWGFDNVQNFIQSNLRDLNMIVSITDRDDQVLGAEYRKVYEKHSAALQ
ncbi:protein O-mannosyl-transferase family [Jiulongibacter sp. NS-SX5]|uniref:protein O-mannosyl-transferase family n=1 Tax=Jiulongibacter sp. NS-SX5 TaxID=3463854 RepID=UPI004059E7EA